MVKFETLTIRQQNITGSVSVLLMIVWLVCGSYLIGHFSCPESHNIGITMVILGAMPVLVGSILCIRHYFNERNKRR